MLRVYVQQEPGTLNPVVATLAAEIDAFNLIFDGLFRVDDRGELVPDLATEVPTRANGGLSADGKTITYHLVHNARWHDGQPVTSDDVKFTFEAIMNPMNNVVSRLPYDKMKSVRAPDPYTVVVTFDQPFSPALMTAFTTYNQGAIVPAHVLRGLADLNRIPFNSAPVGSGPYKLTAWHRGSDMVFDANPDYYRGAPKSGGSFGASRPATIRSSTSCVPARPTWSIISGSHRTRSSARSPG